MIQIIKMQEEHLQRVAEIEKKSFKTYWSKNSFLNEIKKNKFAIYLVAIDTKTNEIIGYGGMWHVINEGHITNIAVDPDRRRQGIASKIIDEMVKIAKQKQMIGLTLEVRVSNTIAKELYIKYGFVLEGIRKEYYEDNREDAYIMWKYLDSQLE